MTVQIEFQPDQREADAAQATDPVDLFGETLLLIRVRFRVDGRDMLPIRRVLTTPWVVGRDGVTVASEPVSEELWPRQPLVGLLGRLERAIEESRRRGSSNCYLIEQPDLLFDRRSRSMLEVTSPDRTTVAAAPFDHFDAAIDALRAAARAWLEEAAPRLTGHPKWIEWFPPA